MTNCQFTHHNFRGGHNSQVWPESIEQVTDWTSPRRIEITVQSVVTLQLRHNPFCYQFKNAIVPVGIAGNSSRVAAVGRHMFIRLIHTTPWASARSRAIPKL